MPTDNLRDTRKKRAWFAQVSEVEKQLWARIQSHGVLDKGVKDLYRKTCSIYEKLFLSDNELQELQNIEYLLWRLHYKHIDEFRKIICQSKANEAKSDSTVKNVNVHKEGFRLFLSEATKFYQDLIRSIKRYNSLFDEPWFYKNDGVSGRIDQTILHKCQFVCHRLCICLGDLARYLELYEKPSHDQRNWAVAAGYYLEAAKIYPDGGNPQNQLAVLATYIGKEFLALYHCIRSLAVKEPFPDALQNLMLLFERNRSSNIASLTNEEFDFCKPSDWISKSSKDRTNKISTSCRTSKVTECDPSAATPASDLWTLFIRMTSFFFLESRLESFASTFTSALREFEALLALDVGNLSSALQSYQNMNLLKAGPYRALHVISVLLFVIYNLTVDPDRKIWKPTENGQQSELVSLALTVTFTFMGRLVDRCLMGSPVVYFPVLPAVLVFVEWLVDPAVKLDALDEKCEKSVSYFFDSFVKLLQHLQENTAQFDSPCNVALWEDYELRGFIPLSTIHESLDFSSHWEDEINYKMKNKYRAHRIIQAAIRIAQRFNDDSRKWLVYNRSSKKFTHGEEPNMMEEEEDIVFKPIARHNSEPITIMDGEILEASDECLRRASSLLVAQNRALIDSLISSSPTISTSMVSESVIAAGPPSLSSWVLSGDITKSRGPGKTVLESIAEDTPSEPLLNPGAVGVSCSSPVFGPQSGRTAENPDFDKRSPGIPTSINHSSPFAATNFPKYPAHDIQKADDPSGFGLLDHWSRNDPLASLPTVYCEGTPPLFNPSPSLLHGLHEQRRDIHISEPRPLLQYLKQREWQLQQESRFTGSYVQK
ncbi:nonsense-mediated mRNA decay factor SMG7-like [Silene latifolia]|uniref:nonsense-mediated mRNA decay factor SMG7-like n=1 Tax=Silene latifolia TaxID=37657 RepID=UPI003D780D1C